MLKTNSISKDTNLSLLDYVLILGIVLAPMTGLRFWKIGPGEIMCLVWSAYILLVNKVSILVNNSLTNFWYIWIITTIIGTFHAFIFYPLESDPIQLTTYIYLLIIALSIYNGFMKKSREGIERVLEKIFVYFTLLYTALYIYSVQVSPTILGAPLWFGRVRFTGGGTNPHQIAAFTGLMFIYGIRLILKKNGIRKKLFYIIATSLNLFLGLQTKSSTLVAAWILSLILGIFFMIQKVVKVNKEQRKLFNGMLISGISIIVILFAPKIFSIVLNWIQSDPNGIGRFIIWSSISQTFLKSPLWGLGPGNHAWTDHFMEYHNSYLEIFAMSGTIGLVNLFYFICTCYKRLLVEKSLLMMLIVLLGYSMGGFVMRRLVFWTILPIILVLASKIGYEKNLLRRA